MKIKFMLHSFSPESMIGLTFEVYGIWQYRTVLQLGSE